MLTSYQKLGYKWFGQFGERRVNDKLREDLQSAHMNIRAGAYLSFVLLSSILVSVVSFIVSFLLFIILLPFLGVVIDLGFQILFLLLPVVFGVLTYFISLQLPGSRAKARGKKIDVHLAYALNFISAMASAGVTPTEIFKSLSKQETYGEVKEEAAWIYRDVSLLGADVLTAIKTNIERTPSQKFKEFLQGLVVTVTSGGSLKTYFMTKANQYMAENRQMQKQLMESLGIMAEAYVTAAVAGILLLLIVIPLMMLISGGYNSTFLFILIFIVVPLIHVMFGAVIRGICQGA